MKYSPRFLPMVPIIAALTFAAPAQASDKGWATASDIGRDALVASAFLVPAVQEDWDGDLQALGSIGAAFALTQGAKQAFPRLRPDGSDNDSFPSGHSSTSFAAAATLQNRYGWKVGLPAQLVAAFVGVARVQAHKHYWSDVLVGAAIGEAAGFLITSRHDSDVQVIPFGDTKSAGVVALVKF
jgi:membrane-associated phospholipid phosphatase